MVSAGVRSPEDWDLAHGEKADDAGIKEIGHRIGGVINAAPGGIGHLLSELAGGKPAEMDRHAGCRATG